VLWMPEVFTAAIADAWHAQQAARANDAVPYYEGIMANQPEALIRSFAGQPRVNDPRVGHVEGKRELRAFVSGTADWLRGRDAVVENVALTRTQSRTVEEVVLHLLSDEGARVELPMAIVTDRNPEPGHPNRGSRSCQSCVGSTPLRLLVPIPRPLPRAPRRCRGEKILPRSPVCGQSETVREGYRGTSNALDSSQRGDSHASQDL
jgi:hypothetical protein